MVIFANIGSRGDFSNGLEPSTKVSRDKSELIVGPDSGYEEL